MISLSETLLFPRRRKKTTSSREDSVCFRRQHVFLQKDHTNHIACGQGAATSWGPQPLQRHARQTNLICMARGTSQQNYNKNQEPASKRGVGGTINFTPSFPKPIKGLIRRAFLVLGHTRQCWPFNEFKDEMGCPLEHHSFKDCWLVTPLLLQNSLVLDCSILPEPLLILVVCNPIQSSCRWAL